jgi:hypothetical protein
MKTFTKNRQYNFININGDVISSAKNIIKSGNYGCSVIIPHVCNNIDTFGGGFTGDIHKSYPMVKDNYHMLGKKNVLGYTQYVVADKDDKFKHQLIFANMIAQNGTISAKNPRPLNYLSLVKCMIDIKQYIKQNFNEDHNVQIHCPKFGSGLAGGNWFFIQELIQDIWGEFSVFVYSYINTKK